VKGKKIKTIVWISWYEEEESVEIPKSEHGK
jgi:hypothetical protein